MEIQPVESQTQSRRERDASFSQLQFLRDRYNTAWMPPGVWEARAAAITVSNQNHMPFLLFDPTNDSGAQTVIETPKYWTNGAFKVRLFWSTSSTSTNNCRMQLDIRGWKEDTALSGYVSLYSSGIFSLAGSGTADYLQIEEYNGTSNIIYDYVLITAKLVRWGSNEQDTNPDDFQFHGLHLEYFPRHRA